MKIKRRRAWIFLQESSFRVHYGVDQLRVTKIVCLFDFEAKYVSPYSYSRPSFNSDQMIYS